MPLPVRFIAIALLALALAACALQDGLIFFRQPPAGVPQLKSPAVLQEVALLAADGTRLYGWIARHAQGRAPLVIYFGGNAEEISWFVGESGRLNGWSMLAVNYRGYGRSEGEPGEKALFADALTVYDHCIARPDVDPGRIVLMGRSLGSSVAVHLASHRPVAGVVLVAPFDSLVEVGASLYPFLPMRSILRHRFDSLSVAPSVKAPALMIAGERDTIVPARHAKRIYEAWGGPREWLEVPEAGHNDLEAHAAYWTAIRRFLDTLARKAGD
ncbi:MAG: alpha/beta fold hydrolase [Betaproteobacteria bacterium]|nr:alpha/beta fold hydrolase [Betaproteobacteria bacterium]